AVDNFDYCPETIHGRDSLHIVTQIIIQNPTNYIHQQPPSSTPIHIKSINDKAELINRPRQRNYNSVSPPQHSTISPIHNNSVQTTTTIHQYHQYEKFIDLSTQNCLFGYRVVQYYSYEQKQLTPLLCGFFSSYLIHKKQEKHKITYCSPINESPTSREAALAILKTTKSQLIDSGLQKQAIIIMDEGMYQAVIKVKDQQPKEFQDVFILAGDFHALKTYMIMVWKVLAGSGIHELLGNIYQGATLRSILEVTNFNKSLRATKLLYTALSILCIENFITSTSALSSSQSIPSTFDQLPSYYATDEKKKQWFTSLLEIIHRSNLQEKYHEYSTTTSSTNIHFKFWYYILNQLFQPCIELLVAVRTQNFNARNAAWSKMVPMFFANNRFRYAKLGARNLADLQTMSDDLLQHLTRSFAVQRSDRAFSSIPVDQALECSINRLGQNSDSNSQKILDLHKHPSL
ncbi:unnamed protein product, partial [Didymodactylos carnosus]